MDVLERVEAICPPHAHKTHTHTHKKKKEKGTPCLDVALHLPTNGCLGLSNKTKSISKKTNINGKAWLIALKTSYTLHLLADRYNQFLCTVALPSTLPDQMVLMHVRSLSCPRPSRGGDGVHICGENRNPPWWRIPAGCGRSLNSDTKFALNCHQTL